MKLIITDKEISNPSTKVVVLIFAALLAWFMFGYVVGSL